MIAVSRGLIVLRFAPASGGDLPDRPDALLARPACATAAPSAGSPPSSSAIDTLSSPARARQDNPAAQRHLLRCAVRAFPTLKLCSFRRGHFDRQSGIRHGSQHSNPRDVLHSYLRDTTLDTRPSLVIAATHCGASKTSRLVSSCCQSRVWDQIAVERDASIKYARNASCSPGESVQRAYCDGATRAC